MRWLLPLLLFGCGAGPSPGDCVPEIGARLPGCIETTRGRMSVELQYIPGVVRCEMGMLTDEGAALEAQAIAARTYLLRFLERKGTDAEVPIGAHFQCWRSGAAQRHEDAAKWTRDVVLLYGGKVLNANYVSGTPKRAIDCTPNPPTASGYAEETWAELTATYLKRRKARSKRRWKGVAWTEAVVTRNEGRKGAKVRGTPMASKSKRNRGALSQYGAACLALNLGYETHDILRWFYGDDVELSRELAPAEP